MSRSYSTKKTEYFANMTKMISEYKRMIFVDVDNVRSQQMHKIRSQLRGKAEILMGKNTLMRRIIRDKADGKNSTKLITDLLEKVVDKGSLVGNLGIIFTNGEFDPVLKVIRENRVNAPARVGSISPVEVIIPAGNTGMDPGVTAFFQALQINTKIVKGSVEIMTEKKVLTVGQKVDNSTAVLLHKLKIMPFFYGLQIRYIFDNGDVYGPEVLELTDEAFNAGMMDAIKDISCISLATGIPTEVSAPHLITTAFKNVLSLCLGSDYTFDEYKGKEIVEAVKSGKSLGGPAPAAAAATGNDKPAAKVESDSDDDEMGLGLFD